MTRNIQKQHEKELKDLQFAGTNGVRNGQQDSRQRRPESRPQRSCPCGSGKKYKKCHGA